MARQIPDYLLHDGIILCRSILAREHVTKWKSSIDAGYHDLEVERRNGNNNGANITRVAGTRERFVPKASSFTIGARGSRRNVSELLESISTGVAGMWIRNILG